MDNVIPAQIAYAISYVKFSVNIHTSLFLNCFYCFKYLIYHLWDYSVSVAFD